MAIAVATPPIFPTPTLPPIAVATAWNGVNIPFVSSVLSFFQKPSQMFL